MSVLDDAVVESIRAGHWLSRKPVDLIDILERVDAREKLVPEYDELDSSLRSLVERGLIEEIEPGKYRRRGKPGKGETYRPLRREIYDATVTRYQDEFSADVVRLMRSPIYRLFDAAGRKFFRRRWSAEPEWTEPDEVAIFFVADKVVAHYGGSLRDPVGRTPLEFPVSGVDSHDRDELVAALQAALAEKHLDKRATSLLFEDGSRVEVAHRGRGQ